MASERGGYRWRNEEAGFQAELRDEVQEGLLRFAVGEQAFTLSPVGATPARAAKQGETGVVYPDAFQHTDIEYALVPQGVKETLILKNRDAPTSYRFRLQPADGTVLALRARGDGGYDIYDGISAVAVATLAAPVVNDTQSAPIARAGGLMAPVDNAPAQRKAAMTAERQADGSLEFPRFRGQGLIRRLALQVRSGG